MKSVCDLYQLPWRNDDHPNAWLEPTTACQLRCPHCYRECVAPDPGAVHRPLAELTADIDTLRRIRNIQTISIAGGEPLLYPELDDLISHARAGGLSVMLYTNGILLDEQRLRRLADSGVTRIVVHMGSYQQRKNVSSEADLEQMRTQFCRMFRREPRLSLGFSLTVSGRTIRDIEPLIGFCKRNSDVVRLLLFTLVRDLKVASLPSDEELSADTLVSRIREVYGLEYCACTGRTLNGDTSWRFAVNALCRGRLLGSIDAQTVEAVQQYDYRRSGRYVFVRNGKPPIMPILRSALRSASLRRILFNRLKMGFAGRIDRQVVLVINPVERIEDGWNCCSPCHDPMLYDGRLIPSCLLDQARAGDRSVPTILMP